MPAFPTWSEAFILYHVQESELQGFMCQKSWRQDSMCSWKKRIFVPLSVSSVYIIPNARAHQDSMPSCTKGGFLIVTSYVYQNSPSTPPLTQHLAQSWVRGGVGSFPEKGNDPSVKVVPLPPLPLFTALSVR